MRQLPIREHARHRGVCALRHVDGSGVVGLGDLSAAHDPLAQDHPPLASVSPVVVSDAQRIADRWARNGRADFARTVRSSAAGASDTEDGRPGVGACVSGPLVARAIFYLRLVSALAVGTLSFGSTIGAIALGLAFVAHSSSILDLLFQSNERTTRSIILVGLVTFVGLLALYIPVRRTVLTFVNARTLLIAGSPLQAGDNLVFVPRTAGAPLPSPGASCCFATRRFESMEG